MDLDGKLAQEETLENIELESSNSRLEFLSGRTVIIIDEDMANAFSIAGHLASHQADRMIENQFQNAVDICSSVYFDLIFLSSSIGAEDYTKYIEAFRTIPIYENTIILLMLKQNDQELEVIRGDCGVNDSVSIPADFNQITTNIKKYI